MTNRSEILTLVAAALKGAVNNASEGEADECGNTAVKIATAALKAMDEVSATINSDQVDSSKDVVAARLREDNIKLYQEGRTKDAEIARLKDEVAQVTSDYNRLRNDYMEKHATCRDNYASLEDSFADYRSRMESPLTEQQATDAIFGAPPHIRICDMKSIDAAIRKVREGRKP